MRATLILLLLSPVLAEAQPVGRTGPVAAPGNSSLAIPNSGNAVVNFQSFSIGAGETVKFQQPNSSATLNRVQSNSAPQVQGVLQANPSLTPNVSLQGPSPAFTGVEVQRPQPLRGAATEAVSLPDGRIVFRAAPQ